MAGKIKFYEYRDVLLTEDNLIFKGGSIPVKEILSFEIADCGSDRSRWMMPIIVGAAGYAVLWFCAGDNSFVALNNMTGVFLLGIVVFSVIVVMRSLDHEMEGAVKMVVTAGGRRTAVLRTRNIQEMNRFEEALKKALEYQGG